MKAMTFPLDLGVNDSFENYITRDITNDQGEILKFRIGYALVQEWRKLMFINALEVLKLKQAGAMRKDQV